MGVSSANGDAVMLRWWRRWRLRRTGQVYRYFDGLRWRDGDPLTLWRALVGHPDNIPLLAPAYDEGKEPDASRFIDAICTVFGLTRFDGATGRGLLESEILGVLTGFHAYLEDLKKKLDPGSTSASLTDGNV